MSDAPSSNHPLSYLLPGQKLGKYEIKTRVGRGGTADVYRANNPDLNQDVAIKLVHAVGLESDHALQRLRREAQAIAALNHPNIIRVFDFHADHESFFIVMELINGPTLQQLIQNYPQGMPHDLAMNLFLQIISAVAYAHAHRLIHRDIKPGNVLIADGHRAVLTDFGLAVAADSARFTATGGASGTPMYMAPEILLSGATGPQSDVYALGILLYEMITGAPPFKGETLGFVMQQHLDAKPIPPSKIVPTISRQVERVILRALQKQLADRYPSAQEMLRDLVADSDISVGNLETIQLSPTELGLKPAVPATSQRVSLLITQTIGTMQRNPVLSAGFILAMVVILVGVIVVIEIRQALVNTAVPPAQTALAPVTVTPVAPEGMAFIPGGTFTMGTTTGTANQGPPHDVTLSKYFIDRTEVTNSSYLPFVLDTQRDPPSDWLKQQSKNWILDATDGYSAGSPMARFSYDGHSVTPINGNVHFDVNADTATGNVIVQVDGSLTYQDGITKSGRWKIAQKSYSNDQSFYHGGVAMDVQMHGDSGQEAPFLPKVTGMLATWGTADLYLDDQLLISDLGIHTMYTPSIRNPDHQILKSTADCCYNPATPGMGFVDPSVEQVTVLLFTQGMYTSAAPSKDSVWLDLYFTKVDVKQRPTVSPVAFPTGTGKHPVTNVTWADAAAYCEYVAKRLPTEAEWEHAARGPNNWLYPWANTAKINGSIPANWTSRELQDVGSYPAGQSAYGLLDMAGNAWEWVSDWYASDYYANSPKQNPSGPANGLMRLLRGGGFTQLDSTGSTEYTSTYRLPRSPDTVDPAFGFRCAKDVQ